MKRLAIVVAVLFSFAALVSMAKPVVPQAVPVTLITAPAGSTLANCGTPTIPSLCIVATGVYAWQNSTQGWFLLSPPVAGPANPVLTINGVKPGTTGNIVLAAPVASGS